MRLTDLLGSEVVTEDGESLGKVHDVRVRRLRRPRPDGCELSVTGLVVGGLGLRERLGLDAGRTGAPIADRDVIEWQRVDSIDGKAGRIVVRPEPG